MTWTPTAFQFPTLSIYQPPVNPTCSGLLLLSRLVSLPWSPAHSHTHDFLLILSFTHLLQEWIWLGREYGSTQATQTSTCDHSALAIFVNTVLLATTNTHLFAYCLWLLPHNCGNWVVPTVITWPAKPKIVTFWIFSEKVTTLHV